MNIRTDIHERTPLRMVFISSIMTPQQAKLCAALNDGLMEAHFWFYEDPERTRGSFWRVDPTSNCHVVPGGWILRGRYINLRMLRRLREVDPDVVMLGGFSIPGNYLAYLWARCRGKRTVVFTERSRTASGVLRRRGLAWRVLHWMYRKVDMVIVSADDAVPQFRDEFRFGSKVVAGRYASDIDNYLSHSIRRPNNLCLIFPNRLTEIYDPLLAIQIFAEFRRRNEFGRLLMNAKGELRSNCEAKVAELGLSDHVTFLDDIRAWEDLGEVYERSDVMILPAKFSNGNFTILEAMASGMGIVISDKILGVGNLIVDGENGFRCAPNTQEFVKRLEAYIADPTLFEMHANLNRDIVKPLGVRGTAEFFNGVLAREFAQEIRRFP